VIYNNFETKARNIKTYCELSVTMVDSVMVLSGAFHTRTRDLRKGDEDLATGMISVQKQNIQAQTRLIGKLDSLKLSNTLVFSTPEAVVKEAPVVAVAKEERPAVAQKEVPAMDKKEVPAVTGKEAPAVAGKEVPAVAQKEVPAVAKEERPAATEKGVPAAAQKEAPAVAGKEVAAVAQNEVPALAEDPGKELLAAKVQQQVAIGKSKNAIAADPKVIAAAPEQKVIVPVPAADIALRKTEVIRTIDFKSDSLTLVLYDNGIVDGDTVSVVLNGEIIIPNQRLTEEGYRKVIKIPPGLGDSLRLVIYAENLGSIPPNSGLLIIEEGSDRQEVGFEGDLKKSSAVILRRKQKG
jgi:hypothetical protein